VEQLKREFPACQIRLVVCGRKLGANGKVSSIVADAGARALWAHPY